MSNLLPILRTIVISYCLVTAAAAATPWSEALLRALLTEDWEEADSLIETGSREGGLASDFTEIAAWIRASGNKNHAAFLQLRLDWALDKDFNGSSQRAYTEVVLDPRVEGETRLALLRVMLRARARMDGDHQDSLFKTTLDIAGNAEAPGPLRAFALAQLGSQPALPDFKVFLPFVNGNDEGLKAAAFQGLAGRILANRWAGRSAENRAIFAALRAAPNVPLELDRVRAVATLSEDYSRTYLLDRCRGDAARIAVIFHRDEGVQHPGLILEALNLMDGPAAGPMRKALLHGLKDPPVVIATLKKGSARERAAALKLQGLFPESLSGVGGR
ncbi:MAG TPA: hypothetical protein VK465_19035 [Fibrobacteria bacterium]|nr:hypothetical protein [Fibrobacteria bacterium]